MTFPSSSTPTAEALLQTLDNAAPIADSRKLVELPPAPQLEDEQSIDEHFKERVRWQLALQGVLNSLSSKEMLTFKTHEEITYALTSEGHQIAREGSHEARLWATLPEGGEAGRSIEEIRSILPLETFKVGQGKGFAKKWIRKDPNNPATHLARAPGVDTIHDDTREELLSIRATGVAPGYDEKKATELKKRKLIVLRKLVYFTIDKGPQFSLTIKVLETDLTSEMLANGSWKDSPFKKYNFDAEGALPAAGALHPLLKVREEFRKIFFEMGFSEMPTNRYVESSFWCFDALFVPQQHPARDVQDTFFVKDPPKSLHFDEDYLRRVSQTHEQGGYGSTGYRYPFSVDVTSKLVLRTHTTAVSAAMLERIARSGFKPTKLFSIDRVFRNEAVDMTHLAEFHQVEGVVADYNITLGDLIGFMQIFFAKMGVHRLRFKPAYNPYTEPSLEIFSYHSGLKKWVEVGNSGMFRPELLRPMGLPEGINVLGWGLSLERPTMIRYGINNIRELLGHKVPIESVERSAAVRFP